MVKCVFGRAVWVAECNSLKKENAFLKEKIGKAKKEFCLLFDIQTLKYLDGITVDLPTKNLLIFWKALDGGD
jgi:hypothetical protein